MSKTKNQFGFGFKNRTVQKFDNRSDGFLTETACNPQFKLIVTKTLVAFNVQLKNVVKHHSNRVQQTHLRMCS